MSDPGNDTDSHEGSGPDPVRNADQDRRKEQRAPSYLGGRVTFSQQKLTAECVVRDRSEGGALLFVDGADRVPDSFDLVIAKTKAAYRVRTRWRQRDALGVEITERHAAPAAAVTAQNFVHDKIRRLRSENERLKRRLRALEE